MSEGKKKITAVALTPKQKKYIKDRDDINFSGWVRSKIDELMQENHSK